MSETRYISVIVPLKLDWEPTYALPEDVRVSPGDCVRLKFAGKEYVAVVSGTDLHPAGGLEKIRTVIDIVDAVRIEPGEISFWRQIADYYMCTVGEVYKAVCAVQKSGTAPKRRPAAQKEADATGDGLSSEAGDAMQSEIARQDGSATQTGAAAQGKDVLRHSTVPQDCSDTQTGAGLQIVLSPAQNEAYESVKSAFRDGRPALLYGVTGSGKTEIYTRLARETLSGGRNVLYLVPEIALTRQLEERLSVYFPGQLLCYHSGIRLTERRRIMERLAAERTDKSAMPYILLGTRSALFLPLARLGLIVVDEEHDSSYKQDSPAPRYNGRDVALMLAAMQGSGIVLGSATPSFESMYNCFCGRFREVRLNEKFHGEGVTEVVVIDTVAERKKYGMVGSISRKLISLLKKTFESGGQAMVLRARKSYATTVQCSECGTILRCPHCNVSLNWQKARGRIVCNHCGWSAAWSEHIPHLRPEMPDAAQDSPGSDARGTCASSGTTANNGTERMGNRTERLCDGRLAAFGAGTEKIEEELGAIFPERTVARLDSDTSAKAGWQKKVLKDFADKKIDILLGTQMLTKGFDFDNLSLVAVIQADSLLGQQDFRADEKAVQLLEQFKGRCSRRGQKGIFAIQTAQAEHPVYRMLLEDSRVGSATWQGTAHTAGAAYRDADSAAELPQCIAAGKTEQCPALSAAELPQCISAGTPEQHQTLTSAAYRKALLEERRMFGYPPYTRLINIILKDDKLQRLERIAETLSLMLRGAGAFPGKGVTVTPPFAPAVDRIRDEYIRIIRISLPKDRCLKANKGKLGKTIRDFAAERRYAEHITIDVDPS